MAGDHPTTPPRAVHQPGVLPREPPTPEQIRNIEIKRLKAKALRDQRENEARRQHVDSANNLAAGQKRSHATMADRSGPSTLRDARASGGFDPDPSGSNKTVRPLDSIEPARSFAKYVEYDFSKMTDTKGGFLTEQDDPHNRALNVREPVGDDGEKKPAHMTLRDWERLRLLKKLREQRQGPFEPGIGTIQAENKVCRECGSLEVDRKWVDVFNCCVCQLCKDRVPEKYSLLTKTEAKEDYLLTDPELKDEDLLPHLEKPNPHKSTWNNMMLFLRYQVEEYAINKKWGGEDKLDEAFEKRESEKKRRKQEKFKSKLQELKKKTRVEAWRRARKGEEGGEFGDDIRRNGRHVHEWGRPIVNEDTGVGVKKCVDCGMEVEEIEF